MAKEPEIRFFFTDWDTNYLRMLVNAFQQVIQLREFNKDLEDTNRRLRHINDKLREELPKVA